MKNENRLIKSLSRPECIFLILGLAFGLILIFVTPPYQVPDESTHFMRSYQLSEGKILSLKRDGVVGGEIPLSILNIGTQFPVPFGADKKISFKNIISQFSNPLEKNKTTFASFPNTALYSPVPYLPQTIGISIGKTLNLPIMYLFYLGRFVNLIVWLALIYCSIKMTPILKWGFVLIALMPMTVFQAASLSADAITVGLSFLFMAIILELLDKKNRADLRTKILIFLLAILITLSKQTYAFIPLMFFILPRKIIGSDKEYTRTIILFILLVASSFLIWSHFVKFLYIPLQTYVNPNDQIAYIAQHPFWYMRFILSQAMAWFSSIDSRSIIGHLGWLDVPLPGWVVSSYKIILILTFIMEAKTIKIFNFIQRLLLGTILVLSILFIFTVMYLTWNPIGSGTIEGIQGRYFIPLLPLLFILLYSDYFKTNKRIDPKYFVPIYLLIILLETVRILIYRYYV